MTKKWLIAVIAALVALVAYTSSPREEEPSQENDPVEKAGPVRSEPLPETKTDADVGLPAPLAGTDEQIVRHTGFVLSYNKQHNTPNWVAWHLTADKTDGPVRRSSKFWPDPELPRAYRVDHYDYQGSGYDRGHMCPAGDMKWSGEAMHDCFYMSNMCPQTHELNNGSWKKLEEACRKWAVSEGDIYIVSGPVYQGKRHERIGVDHVVEVPEGFYKVVLSLRTGSEKAIGFYYENSAQRQPIAQTAMSVDEVEKMTGIDFFSRLDDKLEDQVESQCDVEAWK